MRSRIEWTKATLDRAENVAADVRELVFDATVSLARFQPGSHINVKVETPHGPALRTYTCVGNAERQLTIAVKQHANSRGGSAYMWRLQVGDQVDISLPENRFDLSWGAPSYLLVAGGIGVTPLVGMAHALSARGAKVRMIYAARSAEHMAYAQSLRDTLGADLTLFSSLGGERINFGAEIEALTDGAEIYACGPIRMLNDLKAAWANAERPASHLRFEVFGDSGAFAEQEFEVEILNRPGKIRVRPDETLLDALLAADVPMIFDCQRGECGLCAVGVLEHSAEIDHRDVFFSADQKAEGGHMCACVSRFNGGGATIDTGYRR